MAIVEPIRMSVDRRRKLAEELLAGYQTGPGATARATAQALERLAAAHAVVLVEGISDMIAVESLATRAGRRLESEGVVVLPLGGAHSVETDLTRLGPLGREVRVAGLCDAGEASIWRRSLEATGFGPVPTRTDMERLGFFVCVEDLEDEWIRALGPERIERLLDSQGDLGSFRTLQRQPAWRGRDVEAQLRRFVGAGARRKARYARLAMRTIDMGRVPRPLAGVLSAV